MTEAQISTQTVSEIRLLSDVARANQDHLSLKDIVLLTSTGLTESELRAKWNSIPELSSTYRLEEDLLLAPGLKAPEVSNRAVALVKENKARAQDYLNYARAFQSWNKGSSTRLISISGSTSYDSAKSSDDLDFFVISLQDRLWIFLLKSLLLARIFRLVHPRSPRICFSYAVDESFVEKTLVKDDPLLARDILSVVVVQGGNYYHNLVRKNKWISNHFPRLYCLKTEGSSRIEDLRPSSSSPMKKSLNIFLFLLLGQYIRTKSNILNRQFLRKGKARSLFNLRAGPDHCIFDSLRYSRLRQIYNQNSPTIPSVQVRQDSKTKGTT